jgi:DNA polymerase alpha subunit A
LFYQHLFDTEKALSAVRGTGRFGESLNPISRRSTKCGSEEVRALALANQADFAQLAGVAERYLDRNGRRYVDMKGLFGFMEKVRI